MIVWNLKIENKIKIDLEFEVYRLIDLENLREISMMTMPLTSQVKKTDKVQPMDLITMMINSRMDMSKKMNLYLLLLIEKVETEENTNMQDHQLQHWQMLMDRVELNLS